MLECAVLTIFEAGGRQYIASPSADENGEEEGDVYIYRYIDTDPENPDLENIEDDDEYEIAADAFDECLTSRNLRRTWTPSRRPASSGGEAPPQNGKDPHPFRFFLSHS